MEPEREGEKGRERDRRGRENKTTGTLSVVMHIVVSLFLNERIKMFVKLTQSYA